MYQTHLIPQKEDILWVQNWKDKTGSRQKATRPSPILEVFLDFAPVPRLRRSDGDGDADVADAHGADAAAARRPVKRVKRVERRMESRWSEG